MEKFLGNTARFVLSPVLIYVSFAFLGLPQLMKIANGPTAKEQILFSFENAIKRDYDLLILGNSRMYCGINPDIFAVRSYNFSHNNDTYNQLFHKAKYLEKKGKDYRYLILGVDYFQFSFISKSRNYVYGDLLGIDYLNDYSFSLDKLAYYISFLDPIKLKKALKTSKIKYVLKENGQFLRTGKVGRERTGKVVEEDDFIPRNIERLDIQVLYFEKILQFHAQKDIPVFLVMLPTREAELRSYKSEDMKEFNLFLKGYPNDNTMLLDFSNDESYTAKDYADLTHFNKGAADRFSKQLSDSIIKVLDKDPEQASRPAAAAIQYYP